MYGLFCRLLQNYFYVSCWVDVFKVALIIIINIICAEAEAWRKRKPQTSGRKGMMGNETGVWIWVWCVSETF